MFRALALSTILLATPFFAHAQVGGLEALELTLTPAHPRPYQDVTVSVRSSAIDLSASTVVVRVNGTVTEESSGALNSPVRVGGPGERTVISVSATTGGQTYTREVVVRPADVALVSEARTTVPPFYLGGALPASEGRIRLVAVPDVRTAPNNAVSAQSLVYTWRLNNRILTESSGIGKSVLSATAPVRYRDATVSLTVATQDQSIVAEAKTVISPVDPIVRVYRADPLLGPLFETALSGTYALMGDEETFRAVPYFFADTPALSWTLNGATSGSARDLTVRTTARSAGSAQVTIAARHKDTFQNASAAFRVRFGEAGFLGIFGL